MAQVTCRCGEIIPVRSGDPHRLTCPHCSAQIRVRRVGESSPPVRAGRAETGQEREGDGFVRFYCPCGRRLKVRSDDRPEMGKCPDCGRVVPVPESAIKGPAPELGSRAVGRPKSVRSDARTDELDAPDLRRLQQWADRHRGVAPRGGETSTEPAPPVPPDEPPTTLSSADEVKLKMEAGLRICPRCGKPVHLGADICRACGESVPRR